MRRGMFANIMILGLASGFAGALDLPAPIESLTDYVMRERPTSGELSARVSETAASVAQTQPEADRLLYEAMTHFLAGFGERGLGNRRKADASFERATRLAERSIALRETSEAQRVLADSYSQLLDLRGVAYRMAHAGSARRAALRAVELDPANPFAHIAAAAYLASAPPIAGGSVARAREHLDSAGRHADSDYATFLIAVWEARLAAAQGRRQEASAAIARANAVFPANWWLETVAGEIGVDLPE